MNSLAALLTRNFALLWLANFLHWSIYGFQIVLPKYIKHLGGLEDDIGIIMAAFTAVSVFARPAIGGLLARRGAKGFMLWGAVLLGASLVLFAAPWPGTMWLILPRLLQGLSLALFATASSVLRGFSSTHTTAPALLLSAGRP